jgi:hypothetical protein
MVRGLIRNQLPGDRLRVRLPCPPLPNPRFSPGIFFALVLPARPPNHPQLTAYAKELNNFRQVFQFYTFLFSAHRSEDKFAIMISLRIAEFEGPIAPWQSSYPLNNRGNRLLKESMILKSRSLNRKFQLLATPTKESTMPQPLPRPSDRLNRPS